ncbi:cyanophycinase [Natronogracilivirga saccharolytica]|uniref:Cyanophycinase n=1 Tax=Natronogracilivirga saccharolytica TaxID=2812953 RepID=A0A8J7S8M9_9BACT|nr:cyanophycinase [Natronogracilivirga saccharolytica]MBP3193993.1 cyanophycinase [Natronogracilivirga saccharolytica]
MKTPKGTLIAIGGNEQKKIKKTDESFYSHFGEGFILQDIINNSEVSEPRIEVITSASEIPEVVGQNYKDSFLRLGVDNVGILDIRDRDEAEKSSTLDRINSSDIILFSGGNQSKISHIFRDTLAHQLICKRYQNENVTIAGTSAGAVVMSEEMISGGRNGTIIRKNDLEMGKGLGLISEIIFDSHFINRHRFGRLAEAVALHPEKLGVGLGEDTGVLIKEGNLLEIIGSGIVVIFDGSNLYYNQYDKLKKRIPLSLANLTVHLLSTQDTYNIREKVARVHYDSRHHEPEVSKSG